MDGASDAGRARETFVRRRQPAARASEAMGSGLSQIGDIPWAAARRT